MNTVIDVNVVFATIVAWHAHHPSAWNWWEKQPDSSIALCWPVRLGVLRLLTNTSVMNGKPITSGAALDAWSAFAGDPRTFWVEGAPAPHEALFRRNVIGREPSPNLWMDAWLAALAESASWRVTTFDAGFQHFSVSELDMLS